MSLYSGFSTKRLEHDYNKLVQRMMLLVLDQLTLQLQLSNMIVNQSFFDEQFKSLIKQIKSLEEQKHCLPRFGKLTEPFEHFLWEFSASTKQQGTFFKETRTNFNKKRVNLSLSTSKQSDRLDNDEYLERFQLKPHFPMSSHMISRVCRKPNQRRRNPDAEQQTQFDMQNDQFIGQILQPWRKIQLRQMNTPSSNLNTINTEINSMPMTQMTSPVNLETQQREGFPFR